MAQATIVTMVATVLASALLASSGSPLTVATGPASAPVAEDIALLDALGYDAGPVGGPVSPSTISAAAEFLAQRPTVGSASLATALAAAAAATSTPNTRARQTISGWLAQWRIAGGTWAQQMTRVQRQLHLPATGRLDGQTRVVLAHLAAVRALYESGQPYRAEPGDTLGAIAWAIGLPLARLEAWNPAHGPWLWVGQTVVWRAPAPAANPVPAVTPAATQTVPALTPLNPVAALVVLNPDIRQTVSLLNAEHRFHQSLAVSVSGQWALLHAPLVRQYAQAGNDVAIDGYEGSGLNRLPPWGIRRDLTWAAKIVKTDLHQDPAFLVTDPPPDAAVRGAASALGLSPIAVTETLPASTTTRQLAAALMHHPDRTLAVAGNAPINWSQLFAVLARNHFVFLTLSQMWAQS